MTIPETNELAAVFDVDLAALLVYRGQAVAVATDEGGRVAFWFPSNSVAAAQRELAAGKAVVEVTRWSSTIRRLHADYLSPSAKAAIRHRT